MSLTLSKAGLSESRDEALSSVHNQAFEVVTRSTTDIAACSTTNPLIDRQAIRYCVPPLQFLQVQTQDPSAGAHSKYFMVV